MNIKERAINASDFIRRAFESAEDELIGILKECGGFIDTRVCNERPTLYAVDTIHSEDMVSAIQAIRYNEEDGQIYILTNTELDNYQYDNGYQFEYYYNFEGKDEEHLNDAMKDITYFRELRDGYTDVRATINNIVSGLYAYLD